MSKKITIKEAEEAVRTLIQWAGDNPDREGLKDTPNRVARSYKEFFAGYEVDPEAILQKTFTEVENYQEIIMLRDIRFESVCEHHMLPIIGVATIAYVPNKRIVGISKLARVVDIYSKRLQIQEKLTIQIAETINQVIKPKGVAVVIEATHQCMSTRGVNKYGSIMKTTHMLGCFLENERMKQEINNLNSSNKNY
jgi:GTP cyclohydrolase I